MKKNRKKKLMRGIYQRGDWYWLRYVDLQGNLIRESAHTTNYEEAKNLLFQRKLEIKEGKNPVMKYTNYTFTQMADVYLKLMENQRAFKTKVYLMNQLKQDFGNLLLNQITTLSLDLWKAKRRNEIENQPSTVNRFIALIKHMYRIAFDRDLISEEVYKRIRKVKFEEENNKRLRYLSEEEIDRLLNACNGNLKGIVLIALNAGLRKGEILNLRWDDIDLKNQFFLLDLTKNGARKDIPFNDTIKQVLSEQLSKRRLDIPYVFYNEETNNKFVDIKKPFRNALRRAKINDFKFHDLRHTFASYLVMNGADSFTVKELLGHKTLRMTERYTHLANGHKVKAVNLLNGIFNGKSNCTKSDTFKLQKT